jgi:hypothetical protein
MRRSGESVASALLLFDRRVDVPQRKHAPSSHWRHLAPRNRVHLHWDNLLGRVRRLPDPPRHASARTRCVLRMRFQPCLLMYAYDGRGTYARYTTSPWYLSVLGTR